MKLTVQLHGFLIKFLTLSGFFLFMGCSLNIPIQLPPNTTYRYDLEGSINGKPFKGVAVASKAAEYKMRLESKIDVDMLTISSCHRDFAVESAVKEGWFESKRGYEYAFKPSSGIEDVGSCLVRIGEYNKGQSRITMAVIDFETDDETLPAQNLCDGIAENTNGVSICQSRTGLIQTLRFPKPVEVSKLAKCSFTPSSDKTAWNYLSPDGECVVAFQEIGAPHRLHRHTAIGYKDVPIRGD